MRLCVLLLVACGPSTAARTAPPQPQPVRSAQPSPAIDTQALVDRSDPWARHEPHVQAPLGPPLAVSEPESERVAEPAPKPRKPGRRAPCFANRDVLVGSEIHRDLRRYAIGMSSEQPPSGTYGTCTIKDGQLRDAKGTLLAELHCGVTVYAPGIIDPYGFEIGVHGRDVLPVQPAGDAMCWGDADNHSRCWLQPPEGAETAAHYSFAAKLPVAPDHQGPFKGDGAKRFFESHVVSHFTVRVWCH